MGPVGARTLQWIDKYLADVRPDLASGADDGTLFLSSFGQALGLERVAEIVHKPVNDSGIGKRGSCHIFRHTMATLMRENGAAVQFIQAMLGHGDLKTTEIYAHVSIKALKAVHTITHPAKPIRSRLAAGKQDAPDAVEALLAALDAEDDMADRSAYGTCYTGYMFNIMILRDGRKAYDICHTSLQANGSVRRRPTCGGDHPWRHWRGRQRPWQAIVSAPHGGP